MYQVQAFNRNTHEVLMESDKFDTIEEADAFVLSVGRGEGFYSTIFKLDAVWSDLEVWSGVSTWQVPRDLAPHSGVSH